MDYHEIQYQGSSAKRIKQTEFYILDHFFTTPCVWALKIYHVQYSNFD
jgi:hypothetical protein